MATRGQHGGVAALEMTHLQHAATVTGKTDETIGLGDGRGHRLLDHTCTHTRDVTGKCSGVGTATLTASTAPSSAW